MPRAVRGCRDRLDRSAGGLATDAALYGCSTLFAVGIGVVSALPPHRIWGLTAAPGYLIATVVVLAQLAARRRGRAPRLTGRPGRAGLTLFAVAATTGLPLLWQSSRRAAGLPGHAQEEVRVVEHAGQRLLETGTPYLSRGEIAALPVADQLSGYMPYQPGMALFGLPRALAGTVWWSDARVAFAVVTAVLLASAVLLLRRAGTPTGPLIRAVQAVAVLPAGALALATGGDDLPVVALCLLALALTAHRRHGAAGLAVGLAAALKLIAWPVVLVLAIHAATQGRRALTRLAAGGLGLPIMVLLPAQFVDAAALAENVLRFPLGHGLVGSPAASPLPGHLIATYLPGGRIIGALLLLAAGAAIAGWLVRRPATDAARAALVCGYGLLAASLLMPATRFGYLLYPIAFLMWVPVLRRHRPAAAGVPQVVLVR